jgi:hypothetical protein
VYGSVFPFAAVVLVAAVAVGVTLVAVSAVAVDAGVEDVEAGGGVAACVEVVFELVFVFPNGSVYC